MPFKVVITQSRVPADSVLAVLNKAGLQTEVRPCMTEEQVIAAGRDADGLMVGILPLTSRKVLEALPRIKVVALVLAGKHPHGLANPEVIKKIAVLRSQKSARWAGVPE